MASADTRAQWQTQERNGRHKSAMADTRAQSQTQERNGRHKSAMASDHYLGWNGYTSALAVRKRLGLFQPLFDIRPLQPQISSVAFCLAFEDNELRHRLLNFLRTVSSDLYFETDSYLYFETDLWAQTCILRQIHICILRHIHTCIFRQTCEHRPVFWDRGQWAQTCIL